MQGFAYARQLAHLPAVSPFALRFGPVFASGPSPAPLTGRQLPSGFLGYEGSSITWLPRRDSNPLDVCAARRTSADGHVRVVHCLPAAELPLRAPQPADWVKAGIAARPARSNRTCGTTASGSRLDRPNWAGAGLQRTGRCSPGGRGGGGRARRTARSPASSASAPAHTGR